MVTSGNGMVELRQVRVCVLEREEKLTLDPRSECG